MRNLTLNITIVLASLVSLQAKAAEEWSDTLFFYKTWQQVFETAPDTMIVGPVIDAFSPFELYFETGDKKADNRIKKEYIAATIGDTTWLINSHYLKEGFKGDSKKLHGYVPLFFDEKVAYAVGEEYMYAEVGDMAFNVISTYNYYIDFRSRKVLRIDSEKLSALLADYPDLRMRYEGMNDYKKTSIINDYFLKFVDRATEDPMRPDILKLVD